MSRYYIGNIHRESENDEPLVDIGDEITQEEMDNINHAFLLTGDYHAITQILNIVIDNGNDFKLWMNPENLQMALDNGDSPEQLIMRSNKLVLNYAASTKTFVDMAFRLLEKRLPGQAKEWIKYTNTFYDQHIEYRFWCNFRNFIVHCAFPYCEFHNEIESNCEIRCSKSHLLKYKKWKHSEEDIKKMPQYIDLPAMVDKMSALIYALYLQFFYYVAPMFIEGYEYYTDFITKHSVKELIIVKNAESISKETGGASVEMQPLPMREMLAILEILKKHPNIKINMVNPTDI